MTRAVVPHESQLVVIGSSAGGIEALSRLVASLPADFPAPIVIAQHLDPKRPSHLHEILGRQATLPVRVVEERETLEDGVIFVVPSGRIADISQGDLRLRPAQLGAVAPSIDLLLESAATVFGSGLVAVILTGSGSDGASGAWHVKKAGGAVVVENPATAMFPSMPSSVPPSLVDATADLDSIASVLCDLLAGEAAAAEGAAAEDPDREALRHLLDLIHDRSGIEFGRYKAATIQRRVRGRMSATARATLPEYLAFVESNPEEYSRLLNSLLIKVTEFFRDQKLFDYLRDCALPELIDAARREGRELRLWSAGCSTGEEAYSLAMALAESLGDDLPWPDIRIFATDLDGQAIAFARRGTYPAASLRGMPAAERNRHFVKSEGGYKVAKRLRALMVFGQHDLAEGAPFPHIDLLACRNVLIYFSQPMQQSALETFAFSLRPGGLLALGSSETVTALPEPFEPEQPRLRVFRRRPGVYAIPPMRPAVLRSRRIHQSANEALLLAREDAQGTREELETVNEEFQATNEELETLNEELTASVEELRVANEDLATRTDELSAQAALLQRERLDAQEEHDRLRSILASLGDAVVAVDHDGRIVSTNAAYERFFGGARAEIVPEDLAGLPLPAAARPQQRAARGERFRMEFAVTQPGGTRRWFEAVAEPLTAGDRTWGGVLTIRDLSERTMRLSLERLMAAAGHELKTPVAALHGYLQLVERALGPAGTPEARSYTERALAQTRRLGELVERLFDVSRVQAGRLELVVAPVDLVSAIRDTVEAFAALPSAPTIRFSTPKGSVVVHADRGRLEQVFANLLTNAVEHAAATPAIDVTLRRSGSVAVVKVRDEGPGIPRAELPLLFQPYTRLGHKTSSGLGLGLYLSREIVAAHGGTIEAHSTVGRGTEMVVRLPLHEMSARGRELRAGVVR
jgi:PAS domain S-box-containing protein